MSNAAPITTSSAAGERVLFVRLPCNPIFPIGPIYLADHLHKCFPDLPQRILDLAALPVLDVEGVLLNVVDQFRPTLLVFSWRDIQIYAPVDGRGGKRVSLLRLDHKPQTCFTIGSAGRPALP